MDRKIKIDTVLQHYLIAALWSSTGDDGEPLDSFEIGDIDAATRENMREDVADFVTAQHADLVLSGQSEEQIGHDFWLTRNGHGAGFWDRGLGEVGDRLSAACKPYGEVNLYVGDDGKIYA